MEYPKSILSDQNGRFYCYTYQPINNFSTNHDISSAYKINVYSEKQLKDIKILLTL